MTKKRRFFIRFFALLLPACTVDTPVAEGDSASFDDPLGEDMGAWCEASCKKIAQCAGGETERDCPDDCRALLETFVGKNQICTDSGRSLVACLDAASCGELSDDACRTVEAVDRCTTLGGQVTCSAPRVSRGSAMPPPPCELVYDECSNDRIYELLCEGSGPGECRCVIDGFTTGSFLFDGPSCPSSYEARQICGWPITPADDEPSPTPPVACSAGSSSGAAGGGSVGDCEIFFEACSDGTNYGIICDGATANMCTCRIDGEQVGELVSPARICPYVFENDNGGATLNYACGFSIMPAIPE